MTILKEQRRKGVVSGVGVNDAGYSVLVKERINGKYVVVWRCPHYLVWSNLLQRCYGPSRHKYSHTYAGCTVADEWLTFSKFKAWMELQPWEGNQLDKDILIPGNKIYSKETCIFVPGWINSFISNSQASRGIWPLGVSWNKGKNRFQAHCSDPFNKKHVRLGYYDNPQEAHEAWRACKHEHACRYADMQIDQRLSDALRKKYLKGEDQ